MSILRIKWSEPKVFDLRVVVRSVDSSSMLESRDQDNLYVDVFLQLTKQLNISNKTYITN